jgi:hypothetical protein
MKLVIRKNNKGFALLFSVLVSSLLLTIGLSIFSIALKELAISTATRQSIHAFYAADSGRECAKYWDTKKGQISTFIVGQDLGDITCGRFTGEPDEDKSLSQIDGTITTNIPNSDPSIIVSIDTSDGPNFRVEIFKTAKNSDGCDPALNREICTKVVSYGHDTVGGDRVERAIEQNY